MGERPWLERFGDGDAEAPWVLLHGFTGTASSMAALARALAPAVAVAPHLPGHHPALPVGAGVAGNAAALIDALEGAGIAGPWRLVGYSLGGRIAQAMAAAAPERVAELWLIGAHPGLVSAAERDDRRRADRALAAQLRNDGLAAFVARWEALPLFATQSRLPLAVREEQRRARLAHDPEGLARSLEEMGLGEMADYRDTIAALAARTHLVVGALDTARLELTRGIAAATGARLHEIAGAGHNVPLEDPQALAELLRGYSGASSSTSS